MYTFGQSALEQVTQYQVSAEALANERTGYYVMGASAIPFGLVVLFGGAWWLRLLLVGAGAGMLLYGVQQVVPASLERKIQAKGIPGLVGGALASQLLKP